MLGLNLGNSLGLYDLEFQFLGLGLMVWVLSLEVQSFRIYGLSLQFR